MESIKITIELEVATEAVAKESFANLNKAFRTAQMPFKMKMEGSTIATENVSFVPTMTAGGRE